jgi:hypothetical protein
VKHDTTSPLLEVLEYRWKNFIQGIPDPTWDKPISRPRFKPHEEAVLRAAARDHASADSADPFAYGRAMRRMRSGEWLPSEVRDDALKLTRARGSSGVVIPINAKE